MSMWKRTEHEDPVPELRSMPVEPVATPRPAREAATIGISISIRGDVSGDEDLIVQGQVEGTVTLEQNNVIVGKEGRIKANVHARIIEIEGQVEGDLHGDEQVVVRRSGNIRGNVVAPRVTLEDGCKFKGTIDVNMDLGQAAEKKAEKLAVLESKEKSGKEAKQPASGAVRDKKHKPTQEVVHQEVAQGTTKCDGQQVRPRPPKPE